MASTFPTSVARAEPPAPAAPAARPEPPAHKAAPATSGDRPSPTRLMIEEIGGSYVYTVLDRVSGQVLAQIPRERLDELATLEGYAAGAVVDTDA